MAYQSKGEELGMNMTPMIDVVFQLIIFFVVTVKPIDILAHLDVFRPAPDKPPEKQVEPPPMIDIQVFKESPDYVLLQGKPITFKQLEKTLAKLVSYSPDQSILIKCTEDSMHEKLIRVLDVCSKVGLKNLSVFTL